MPNALFYIYSIPIYRPRAKYKIHTLHVVSASPASTARLRSDHRSHQICDIQTKGLASSRFRSTCALPTTCNLQ